MRTKSLLCGCIVLLLMVVTTATPCFADTVIHGCVRGLTGILRIVGPSGQCLPGETPISWNQTGPQGPQGQQGPKGDTGPMGPAGPAGVVNAVHGVVLYNGTVLDGVGFTVGAPTGPNTDHQTGLYRVIFDTAFSSYAHCVVTTFQSPATVICGVSGFGEWGFDVDCYEPTTVAGQGGVILFTNLPTDVSFSFICISEPL
jgi:hypothetical protein